MKQFKPKQLVHKKLNSASEARASCFKLKASPKNFVSATVVISSNGGAAQHVGGVLGQFEFDEDKGCYVQKNLKNLCKFFDLLKHGDCPRTNPKDFELETVYLYSDDDDRWYVNNKTGEKAGWLYNPIYSKTLPTSGWMYSDGQSWKSDVTLSVTPGSLTLPSQFTVNWQLGLGGEKEHAKISACLGVFNKTEIWWRGRPMYYNFKDNKDCKVALHHGPGDYGWLMGLPGFAFLRGSRAHLRPDNEKNWRYITGKPSKPETIEWKPAQVTIKEGSEDKLSSSFWEWDSEWDW